MGQLLVDASGVVDPVLALAVAGPVFASAGPAGSVAELRRVTLAPGCRGVGVEPPLTGDGFDDDAAGAAVGVGWGAGVGRGRPVWDAPRRR